MHATFNRPHPGFAFGEREQRLITLLSGGGDARITLEQGSGLNKYLSAPYPRDVIAYSSSTVSDISSEAFDHLLSIMDNPCDYRDRLCQLRQRIRAAYGIKPDAQIVFAPSGTDLEYVALAAVLGRPGGESGIHNVLLGADETGSGCIHSAKGRYFAKETALGASVEPAQDIPGFGPVSMVDVPVRCGAGQARSSAQVLEQIRSEVTRASAEGKHSLVHGVHGSKTGLVLPELTDIEALQSEFGSQLTFVIDACQARITSRAIADYLDRGAIVLMTGSKFIGAPPFNGWALVPARLSAAAAPLPSGFATIFRQAEWPDHWPGVQQLPASENLSLALRLEAAMFEIERFQAIPIERVQDIIATFEDAISTQLVNRLGVKRVLPGGIAEDLPIEMRTLATLDLSMLEGLRTFDEAQHLHRRLAMDGIRLGQPVKCVALSETGPEKGWGGTLRVGISMPQMVQWSALSNQALGELIAREIRQIAVALERRLLPATA